MTPQQLMKLVESKKCVVWMSGRHVPATFVCGMPFRVVMAWLHKIKPYKPRTAK